MTDYVLGFSVVPYGSLLVATYKIADSGAALSLRKEVSPLLVGFASDFHRQIEPLRAKQCGGHNPRKIAGTNTWSRHATGVAMDFNWDLHPMGDKNTFTGEQVLAIRVLLKKWSYKERPLFRWGGDYNSRKDEMHFELNESRQFCLEAVAALQKPTKPSPLWYHGDPGTRTCQKGMRGDDIGYIQRYIGRHKCGPDDGVYGSNTAEGVAWYQELEGLKPSGVTDRPTWQKLEVKVKY